MQTKQIIVGIVGILGIAVGFAASHFMFSEQTVDLSGRLDVATVLGGDDRPLPQFSLVDHDDKKFTKDNLTGEWSLVFFGFTHCPDICPATLAILSQVTEDLDTTHADKLGIYMVTVDPERDKPAHLKSYVTYFNKDFVGVTGDTDQLGLVTKSLGAVARIQDHEKGATDYAVDHSSHMALINPKGNLYAIFTAPHEPGRIISDLKQILDAFDG